MEREIMTSKIMESKTMTRKTMKTRLAIAVLVISLLSPVALLAEKSDYTLKTSATVKDVLVENIGKKVQLKLDANESIEGTLTAVGDNLVHVSRLAGKDFYDALIRIDRIGAVIIKVRGN
jgi:hypothetical protein